MQDFISKHVTAHFPKMDFSVPLDALDDSAVVDDIVFTSDGHTVKPLFFPGGDIGSLSVAGTVNDISVMGATPLAISCALIIEAGLDLFLKFNTLSYFLVFFLRTYKLPQLMKLTVFPQ